MGSLPRLRGSKYRAYRLASGIAGIAVVLSLSCHAALADSPAAELRATFTRVNAIIGDRSTDGETMQRLNAVLRIAAQVFSFRDAAELALGREWSARTPKEREEFTSLFGNLLGRSFVLALATRAQLDGGVQVRHLGESISGDQASVRTSVLVRNGSMARVEYRMIRRGDRWMIRDVALDGISVVENYHAQIRRVIQAASFGEVLERMRTKVAELSDMVVLAPEVDTTLTSAPLPPEETDRPDVVVVQAPVVNAPIVQAPTVKRPVVKPVEDDARERAPVMPAIESWSPPRVVSSDRPAPDGRVARSDARLAESRVADPEPRAIAEARLARTEAAPMSAGLARAPLRGARKPEYWVQVGAFKDPAAATRLAVQLRHRKLPVSVAPTDAAPGLRLSRVRVGPFADRAKAVGTLQDLERQGYQPFMPPSPN